MFFFFFFPSVFGCPVASIQFVENAVLPRLVLHLCKKSAEHICVHIFLNPLIFSINVYVYPPNNTIFLI